MSSTDQKRNRQINRKKSVHAVPYRSRQGVTHLPPINPSDCWAFLPEEVVTARSFRGNAIHYPEGVYGMVVGCRGTIGDRLFPVG